MSKKQINNEIVLLRGSVEQARVQVIARLSRDAFKLRIKKGSEAHKAKNIRKADRIAAEILAIKKVKKDEMTKYALSNTLNLNEILTNRTSEPLTRIMARIANYKTFSKKIAEFKSKYPNYEEFLGPGRKKKAVLEWKERKKLKKAQNQSDDSTKLDDKDSNNEDKDLSEDEEVVSDTTGQNEQSADLDGDKTKSAKTKKNKKGLITDIKQDKVSQELDKENVKNIKSLKNKKKKKLQIKDVQKKESKDSDEENIKSIVNINTKALENGVAKKEKSENSLGKHKKAEKKEEKSTDNDTKPAKRKKADTSTVISKQAIVKKFTDIIKEEESKPEDKPDVATDSVKSNVKIEKEVDSFFFSGDGDQNYLSVALPKNKSNEEEEEEYGNDRFNKKKFSRPDKFFSKVNKFQNNSNGPRGNERFQGREKPGFNKLNGKQNDRSNNRFNGKSNDRFDKRPNNRFNGKSNDRFNGRPNNKFNDKPNNKFGNDKPFKKHGKDNSEGKSNEVLHPSWEAKKKQQDVLKKGFQGKKIVFGDDV